jgi:hypothetical protein
MSALKISKRVINAVHDFRYLLNRGYPPDSALNFISNHYRLLLAQRHLLARCVFSRDEIARHQRKKIGTKQVRGKELGVDGYNVLITAESILMEKSVVRCDDGFVRDLRAIFGKYKSSRTTERAIEEILKTVVKARPSRVVVFFDKQVSRSGELAARVRHGIGKHGLKGDSRAADAVDFKLHAFDVVATSDRGIIRQSKAVWDISAELLKGEKASILDLTLR